MSLFSYMRSTSVFLGTEKSKSQETFLVDVRKQGVIFRQFR